MHLIGDLRLQLGSSTKTQSQRSKNESSQERTCRSVKPSLKETSTPSEGLGLKIPGWKVSQIPQIQKLKVCIPIQDLCCLRSQRRLITSRPKERPIWTQPDCEKTLRHLTQFRNALSKCFQFDKFRKTKSMMRKNSKYSRGDQDDRKGYYRSHFESKYEDAGPKKHHMQNRNNFTRQVPKQVLVGSIGKI